MKYPAYPQYKDSHVAWLGEVPEHWGVKRLKYLASINNSALPESTNPDFEFSYIDIGSVNLVDGITATESMIFENAPSRARRVVQAGDIIVSTVRTYLRAIASIPESEETLIVSTGFAVIRPRLVESKFLSFALKEASFVENVVSRSVGVSYPAVNASEIGDIQILAPSEAEQTAIADFLDRETGRIDTLVAKKRKLVALLKEKRGALISRAVTRCLPADAAREFGLAPHRNFKPVGIECLTEIPETWTEKKLKHLGYITPGFAFNSTDFESSGIRVLKISNVQTGKLDWTDDSYIPEKLYEKHKFFAVKDGDVVFALTRPIISTGLKAAVARVGEEKILLNQRNARFRPYKGFNYGFLYYTLFSDYFIAEFEMCIDATGQQPNISTIDIANIEIVTPPYPEQTAIATYLDRETAKIDRLVAKVETAINRLLEYRGALITAAVTGKIDVRGVVQ